MNIDQEKIIKAFDGRLIGSKKLKYLVAETLLLFPPQITKFIYDNCWVLSSMDDAWGFTFTGNDLADKHLIFLSDELLTQPKGQIQFTIAHEIGHVILGHRNSTLDFQSEAETRRQERGADEFAVKYLGK